MGACFTHLHRLETGLTKDIERVKDVAIVTNRRSTDAATSKKEFELNPSIVTKIQRETTELGPREAMLQLKRRKLQHYTEEARVEDAKYNTILSKT